MANTNVVILAGNLTRDPELKYAKSGSAFANISIANNERVKKGDEWVDKTGFYDVTLFGNTAEVAGKYLHKGSKVIIEGKLDYQSWEADGQKRSKVCIIGNKMQMLDKKGDGSAPATAPKQESAPYSGGVSEDDFGGDDLPF